MIFYEDHFNSFLQDIEAWMKEHEEDSEQNDLEEDLKCNDTITDDFSKFLEKRIEAVQDK